eukprot:jgi/Mesen1/8307/ME000455S07467
MSEGVGVGVGARVWWAWAWRGGHGGRGRGRGRARGLGCGGGPRVQIPCEMDAQFAGMVEAWAVGVTWKELMQDCCMDEGDVARLLRRTIDLLAQVPHLPHIDPTVAKAARQAAQVMDRPPISELVA